MRLAQTRVLAPDDGIISARAATVGSLTQPGQELFRLIRGGRLEWRAEVTEAELSRLAPGSTATLIMPNGTQVRGRVRMVAPTVDPQTRNGLVYVDLPPDAPAAAVRAGMFARGEFELGQAPALTLPQSAVLLREGFAYVFRLDGDSRVVQTKVGVGRRAGDRIEITDGTRCRCARRGERRRLPRRRRPRARRSRRQRQLTERGDERIGLVDPQPDSRDPAVRHAHAAGHDGLPRNEDPAVPRHRPADGDRQRVAAGRLAVAAGDRRRAQARELDRDAAGHQAHLHQGAGRRGHADRRVPPREADAGSGRRRARRGLARALRSARRPARPGDLAHEPLGLADPHLHRCLGAHGRRGAVLVRRQHRDAAPAQREGRRRGGARRRREPRSARRARSRRACSRSTRPQPTSRASCARSSRRPRAGAPTSAASSSRCAPSPRCAAAEELAAHGNRAVRRTPRAAGPRRERQRHGGRTALGRAAQRQAGGRLRDHAQPRRQRSRGGRRRACRARAPAQRASGHRDHRGLQLRRPGGGELQRLDVRC